MTSNPPMARLAGLLLVAVVVLSLTTTSGAVASTDGSTDTPCDTPNNPRTKLVERESPAVTASLNGTSTALGEVDCEDPDA